MIFLTICTFAGHREVSSSTTESEIGKALIEIIKADKECVFHSGGMGDLGKRYESTMRGMKGKYPEQSIRLVRVLPYLAHEINRDREYFEFYYDDIVVPMELMDVHYRATIKRRNRWTVDQVDRILAYIYRSFRGTFDTIKYAYHMEEPILNLTMKE